jgi:hypothetical protein
MNPTDCLALDSVVTTNPPTQSNQELAATLDSERFLDVCSEVDSGAWVSDYEPGRSTI